LETEINIPFVTSDAGGPKHLLNKIFPRKTGRTDRTLIKKSIDITKQVVKDSGFNLSDIDEIVLVGGQTRMPAIQKAVKDLFGKEPNKSINPDEVVAMGAAIQGGIMKGDVRDVLLLDVIPLLWELKLSAEWTQNLSIKNTTIPTSKTQIFQRRRQPDLC